jgi:hypothetical protein
VGNQSIDFGGNMTHVDQLIRDLRAPDQRGAGRADTMETGVDSIDRLRRLEDRAYSIRAWTKDTIPALLQTPDYSAAIIRASNPTLPMMEIRRRMLLKNARAESFRQRCAQDETLAHGVFVIGEHAIVHALGDGSEVHARQLAHLLSMADSQRVTIVMLGGHVVPPRLADDFTLYHLHDNEPDPSTGQIPPIARVGFVETVMGDWYSTRLDDMSNLHHTFAELLFESQNPEQTRTFIREVLETWQAAQKGTSLELFRGSDSDSPPTPTRGVLEFRPRKGKE